MRDIDDTRLIFVIFTRLLDANHRNLLYEREKLFPLLEFDDCQ